MYEYRVVQIPPTIQVENSYQMSQAAAIYLQKLIDENALNGWHFYRIDTMGVFNPPGCLASLFGNKGDYTNYYVVTFRRRTDKAQQAGQAAPTTEAEEA